MNLLDNSKLLLYKLIKFLYSITFLDLSIDYLDIHTKYSEYLDELFIMCKLKTLYIISRVEMLCIQLGCSHKWSVW